MENHPIPQDVTGFKFKLIGSVTVKQFLYLLGFGILATVAFILPYHFILIRVPLMLLFAGIGAALAFVPIEGRPMDTMIMNFAKAIPSENRYIFRKRGANLASFEFFKTPVAKHAQTQQNENISQASAHDEKKSLLLKKLSNSSFKPDEEETKFFNNVKSFFDEAGGVASIQKLPDKMPELDIHAKSIPVIQADAQNNNDNSINDQDGANSNSQENIEKIKHELDEAKKAQEEHTQSPEETAAHIKKLETQLQQALSEKDELSKKVVAYESDKIKKDEQIYAPADAEAEDQPRATSQAARFVAPNSSLAAGFPTLPDVPNIILGIIRDPRGKTLPNILVEIIDENDTPVRAFKTNSLGQFAAATPLANGRYKIYFEDAQKTHEFETIEINLSGEIFNPLEITSVDSREKLRRELFGGANQATI